MAADAPSSRSDSGVALAIGGACIVAAALAATYLIAPKLVANVFVHALGAVAQLWPGAR
ncbi:MAG: hypothetical protein JNJ73_06685 [Hyphomonadaceae bacterium]|nr:hypothetical protein [Hyphomonadaceae bacterium]